jgi:hypothetical protein
VRYLALLAIAVNTSALVHGDHPTSESVDAPSEIPIISTLRKSYASDMVEGRDGSVYLALSTDESMRVVEWDVANMRPRRSALLRRAHVRLARSPQALYAGDGGSLTMLTLDLEPVRRIALPDSDTVISLAADDTHVAMAYEHPVYGGEIDESPDNAPVMQLDTFDAHTLAPTSSRLTGPTAGSGPKVVLRDGVLYSIEIPLGSERSRDTQIQATTIGSNQQHVVEAPVPGDEPSSIYWEDDHLVLFGEHVRYDYSADLRPLLERSSRAEPVVVTDSPDGPIATRRADVFDLLADRERTLVTSTWHVSQPLFLFRVEDHTVKLARMRANGK